jgi:hypothetical protein
MRIAGYGGITGVMGRKKKLESILQDNDDKECFICRAFAIMGKQQYIWEGVHWHHVFYGTANRRLSEKYKLKVRLCLAHHTEGKDAVHMNHDIDFTLKKTAQYAFEECYPELDFRSIFGKDYLRDGEHPAQIQAQIEADENKKDTSGFQWLDEEN